jgi:secreted trypsin-like serine protease
VPHQEYTVVRILKHPRFNEKRLDHDLAILTLDKPVDLAGNPNVNTVCLPACDDQFDFRFNNGTGTRCWVAGWGKNAADGTFQAVQHKVDIPLVESGRCNADLKAAINLKASGVGNRFALDASELCAGGEVGKDACTGDGGSPLVCQAQSGRWTVVGLVTWGVGCASNIPGVYARINYFRDWINAN